MMKQAHLVSVGTSVLSNFARARGGAPAPLDRAAIEALSDWLEQSPARASAELAALEPYLHAGGVAEVYLVHTETEEGRASAEVLRRYLERRGVAVQSKSIPGAAQAGEPAGRFLEGLALLRDVAVAYVRDARRRGLQVLVNATGGYKPEVAVLVLVASVAGCIAYYRHEAMPEPVELPVLLPIRAGEAVLALLRRLASAGEPVHFAPQAGESDLREEAAARGLLALRPDGAGGSRATLTAAGRVAGGMYEEEGSRCAK